MEDVRMLEIYREIAIVIASLNLCASEKEYENKIRASIDKMDSSYCEMELWLSSKTDYDFLNISETETVKSFARSARNYLNENREVHSGMDIDKGYYNINDSFYMCLEDWYTAYIKRLAQAKVQEMQDLQEIVTLLEQQITEPQQIPPELATTEAKAYFDRAIELGLMDGCYRWLKGLQMLACFAREMSIKLNLGKGMKQVSWKPFETLFSIDAGKLRLNYNDIQKTGQQPTESYLIDKVFE